VHSSIFPTVTQDHSASGKAAYKPHRSESLIVIADIDDLLNKLDVPDVTDYPFSVPCDDALGVDERCVRKGKKYACGENLICLRWSKSKAKCVTPTRIPFYGLHAFAIVLNPACT
jgi:hypothetical protein